MHPRTPTEALDAASRTDPSMREAVASNLSAWPSTVQRLAADNEWDVRVAAAAHPTHTGDTLRDYCESEDTALEAGVASNPGCPEDLLEGTEPTCGGLRTHPGGAEPRSRRGPRSNTQPTGSRWRPNTNRDGILKRLRTVGSARREPQQPTAPRRAGHKRGRNPRPGARCRQPQRVR